MYMASLDVKTAFDVSKPSVASKILSLIGTHGHVVAALLAEMQDMKGRHFSKIVRLVGHQRISQEE